MKDWHFPLINPVQEFPIGHFLDHISLEIEEVKQEPDDFKRAKEVVDVLHAAETFCRKYFQQNTEFTFEQIRDMVIEKNRTRGYYDY
jgi:hypothetical protein